MTDRISSITQTQAPIRNSENHEPQQRSGFSRLCNKIKRIMQRCCCCQQQQTCRQYRRAQYDKNSIKNIVSLIPRRQRTRQVIQDIQTMVKGFSFFHYSHQLLMLVGSREEVLRARLIQDTALLIQGTKYFESSILETIKSLTSPLNASEMLPFIQNIEDGMQRAYIIKKIAAIPCEKRQEILNKALPYTEGMENGWLIASVIYTCYLISENLYETILPKIKGSKEEDIAIRSVQTIEVLPKEQRTLAAVQTIINEMNEAKDSLERLSIFLKYQRENA